MISPGQSISDDSRNDDRLLTIRQAAELLNLSPNSLYHFVSSRRIPVIRISARCIRFSRRALLEWIENLTQKAKWFPES